MGNKINTYLFWLGITKWWNTTWFTSDKVQEMRYAYLTYYLWKIVNDFFIKDILLNMKIIFLQDCSIKLNLIFQKNKFIIEKQYPKSKLIAYIKSNVHIAKIITKHHFAFWIQYILDSKNYYTRMINFYIKDGLEKNMYYKPLILNQIKLFKKMVGYQQYRGIWVELKGRIGGSEIARKVVIKEGGISFNSIDELIDYDQTFAWTKSGVIGIKTWITFYNINEKNLLSLKNLESFIKSKYLFNWKQYHWSKYKRKDI